MYLQGQLQTVFDALYHLGVIDPVLEMDWKSAIEEMHHSSVLIDEVMSIANKYQDDMEALISELTQFDDQALGFLAMEVAREFADYHEREVLH